MSATAAAAPLSLHDRFRAALTHRYFIRLHMSVLLALVLLSGILASRLLIAAGVENMAVRYPIAVVISYISFFGLVRIWIAYVTRASRKRARSGSEGSFEVGDVVSGGGSGGSSGSGGGGGRWLSGGGRFGGGGSSATFADNAAPRMAAVPVASPPAKSGGSSSGSGFSIDLDGDGLLLLLLFALLVLGICGVGAYLVYQAPVILSEAAFHVALVPGLVRTARNSHDPGWIPGVLRATVLPFAIVLALAALFGYQAHKRCPGAVSVRQVFTRCILR
ncbi:MAG TPA: hypothetical protein VKE50_06425 [Thermoanaerobaculia bacterium]|nr:hypothetical protein [Thermoanaerobaculia bacterium]